VSSQGSVRNPIFARVFVRLSRNETEEQRQYRRELLDGLSGRVVDLGAGDGANFDRFPESVTEVIAVEPEPYLRARAEERAASASVPVRVVDGVADDLPIEDGWADAVVSALVLCSVPDQATALAELRRVLRPGGELRFYEHVVADTPGFARFQRVLDRSGVWRTIGGGCHTARDTAGAIEAAGFTIERCRRLSVKPCPLVLPVAPHVLGVARH
jgi:ubiquinone/menaquinone biosynthesis C-methylase UbiE